MRRNSKKRIRLIAILLTFVMLISVGYSAIETVLNISGTATLKTRFINIYFTNVQVTSGSVANATPPTIPANSTSTSTITWTADIQSPGEFYEFTVDVVNNGNADAMIETAVSNIVSSSLTENQAKYLNYSIVYENDGIIEQKDKLAVGETKKLKVRLACKLDANAEDLPQAGESEVTLSYGPNYIKADNTAVEKIIAYTYYFTKPSDWGNTINAYIWKESTQVAPVTWPGTAMTWDATKSAYKVRFLNTSANTHDRIVFNDGTNQTADLTINPATVNNCVYELTGTYNVSGKQRISYKNTSNWSGVYAYFFNDSSDVMTAWPGVEITGNVLTSDIYYAEVNSGQYKYVIFNDGNSLQTNDIFIPSGSDLIYDDTSTVYDWMPVNITDTSSSNEQRIYLSATFNAFSSYIPGSAVNAYAWNGSGNNGTFPGATMTRLDPGNAGSKIYYVDLDHAPGYYENIIFSTNSGNKKTADLTLSSQSNIIYIKGWKPNEYLSSGTWTSVN